MRYKILFISSWFPNTLQPTNGNFVQRHAEAVSLLHDVEILHAIGVEGQKEKFIFDDQKIQGVRTLLVYYKKTKNPIFNFFTRFSAYQKGFAKMQFPDLVHGNILQNQMFFALWLKKKHQIPFLISEHWSLFLKENRKKLSKSTLWIAQKIAKQASFILPVSHILKENLQELKLGNHFQVVENVVDTNLFSLKTEKEKGNFVFLHLSNLIGLKNPDKIIKVAAKLRKEFSHFELHIGGDGDLQPLEELINELKARDFIHTFGEIKHKEVAQKMQSSDCFILFSDYESFGCVLLESLSTGTPVIATKVGAIPEIITDKNGILIHKNEEELYQAMKSFLKKETQISPLELLHQEVEDRFSMIKIAEKFSEVYQNVLEDKEKSKKDL